MTVYVVLLRGVNVGGVKLPMADLRRIAEATGYREPLTYIQSGNLVFASPHKADKIATELNAALKKELGLDIPMIIRSQAELKRVISANPFLKDGADAAQQHVTFFADDVAKDVFDGVDLARYEPEAVRVHKREIYMNLPLGVGHSPMLKDIGRRKGLKIGTARNWRTVTTMMTMADEVASL